MPLLLGVLLLLLALPAAPASGATVEVVQTGTAGDARSGIFPLFTFSLRAEPGEANRITVEPGQFLSELTVRDAGGPLRPGPGCEAVADSVRCRYAGGLQAARIELGDGDDEARVGGLSGVDIRGGPGDDVLLGTREEAIFLDGGPGADRMDAPRGEVRYVDRSGPVSVTVGAGADDGEAGEGDDVGAGIGGVRTGAGDDLVVAGPGPLRASGGAGADVLRGGGGDDTLDGDDGDDRLDGLGGVDLFRGGPGADILRGGDGFDVTSYADRSAPVSVTLDDVRDDGEAGEGDDVGADVEGVQGGAGADRLVGSAAANRLEGLGGTDVVLGGAGDDILSENDLATADRLVGGPGRDTLIAPGLQRVDLADGEVDTLRCGLGLRRAFAADAGLDLAEGCAPRVEVGFAPLRATRDGRTRVKLRCSGVGQRCRGTLRLRSRQAGVGTVGTASFSLAAGRTRAVRVALRSGARRRLRGGRRVRLEVLAVSRRSTAPTSPVRNAVTVNLSL